MEIETNQKFDGVGGTAKGLTEVGESGGNPRTAWAQWRLGAVLVGMLAALSALAVPPPVGVAPVAPPPSGFAIDGDLVANSPVANIGDWVANTNLGTGGSVLTAAGVPINTNRTFHFVDAYNGNDVVFVGGLKWTDNPNAWKWTVNKASSKTDMNNVLLHLATDTNGHVWAVIAADRFSTSGESYIDFEFLQSSLTLSTTNSAFISAGTNGGRTVGDLVLSLAFVDGGKTADFLAYRWQGSGTSFGYADVTAMLPVGRVFVALNSNNIPAPYGAFGQTTYVPNQFAEAAIDLTALLGNFDQCLSFGFKTIMVKTKASSSDTATIEDFIHPIQYSLRIGPNAQAGADQLQCAEGAETAFALEGTAGSGLSAVASTSWSVVSGNATIDSPSSLITTARVSSVSATLRLTVVQANGCIATDDVVLSAQTPPTCAIAGAVEVCPRSTNIFTAPAGMSSYRWIVSGSGNIVGPTNQASVKVVAAAPCGTNFTVALIAVSNVCTVSCATDVAVIDNGLPTITAPPNRILDCPAVTTTNATGVATATDSCSRVTVSYADEVTNGCGATKVIARTWTATDECGNAVSALQTITVRDLTPPVISCPVNRVLEFPADTNPNVTGAATAVDACGSATINFSDRVATNCGNTFIITRTWTATDECGNLSSCNQSITVRDTVAPVITCPTNIVLDYPADISTNVTGVASVSDVAGSVILGYSDTVTTNCGNTYVVARKWTATDECGNRSTCTQNITVRDVTAPLISCPPDVTLECPAVTTTNVTGVATATDESGSLTISYTDSLTNFCGNTKVIARRWTARDTCGNQSSCTQMIRVVDTTAPVIVCASNKTIECTSPWTFNAPTASDTCGTNSISIVSTITNGICGSSFIATRTWRATDACGNTAECSQTVTVVDTTAPTITCVGNKTVECTTPWTFNTPTANDTCGTNAISIVSTITNLSCGNTFSATRTWVATDACGNQSQCSQTVTVVDTTAPVIACVGNKTIECTTPWTFDLPTATDTCGTNAISIVSTTTNAACGNTFTATRTWRATDACGNQSQCSQTVTVVDTTAPVIACAGNKTIECTTPWTFDLPTASDTCGTNAISVVSTTTNLTCGNTFIATRTWRATDACGNQSQCSQTVTVVDTTAPTITCVSNKTIQCGTAWTFNPPTASDTCGTNTISVISTVTNAGCAGTFTTTRTWRATDACGNFSQCSQTVTVVDTTAPVISCPANLTLDCPAITTTNATGVATATDICGVPAITFSDSVNNACGATKTISRTWRATDACGNSSTCVQTITVRDLTPPTISCPASLVVECGASTLPAATGAATASDTCSTATVTYTDATTNLCGGTKIITRTWKATDACSNQVSCIQTITVRDTTPPVLTLPANLVQECPGDTRTNVTGVATATDVCGAVTVGYSEFVTNNCGATKTVRRLWTATDACGNTVNGWQTITVVDTKKPTITFPSVKVQCVGDVPPVYTNLAALLAAGGAASDNCDASLTFSLVSAGALVGSCPATVTRVYRVTDDCGNYTDGTQIITVDDTIAPIITCLPNLTLQCSDLLNPTNTGYATATDNCDTNVSITYNDVSIPSTYDLNWYAADPAPSSAPYLPTYMKFGPGSITCPTGGRAADPLRNAVAYGPSAGQLDALTSMSGESMLLGQIVPFEAVIDVSGGPGPEHGTIEFTANWATHTTSNDEFGYDKNYKVYCAFVDSADIGSIDPHNNAKVESYSSKIINTGTSEEKIEGTFRVSGLDTGDRVVVEIWVVLMSSQPDHVGGTIAADLVSARKALTNSPSILTGTKTISIGGKMDGRLPNPQEQPPLPPQTPQSPTEPGFVVNVIDRTWTATDDCGNRSTCVQRFTVRDAAAPTLVVPQNLVLEIPANIATNVTGVAVAQDACGSAKVTYSDTVSNNCGGAKIISRLWTAIDDWGNTTNGIQTITVRDTTAPTITCPTNATVECGGNTSPTALGSATAADLSGNATVTFADSVTLSCGASRTISRTWTATDACGNTSSMLQTITVRDTTAPTLTCPPNATVEIGSNTSPAALGNATATDLSGTPVIAFSDSITPGCGIGKTIARTWTATDGCGNVSSAVQTITVRDTMAPVIICPTNATVECGSDTSTNLMGSCLVSDLSGVVTLTFTDTVTPTCGTGKTISRRWTAMDACGNSANCTQTIIVRDTTPPAITPLVNKVIFKGSPLVFDTPIATDISGTAVVSVVSTTTNQMSADTYRVLRAWKAVDPCNNTTNTQQAITVEPPPITQLILSQVSPGNMLLRWPTNATGYRLEWCDNLSAQRWYPMATTPIVTNRECRIYFKPSGPAKFFRLSDAPPTLESLNANGKMRLTWPTVPAGFQLESSDTMAPGSWTPVVVTPGVSNTLNTVDLPMNAPKKFFRLKK